MKLTGKACRCPRCGRVFVTASQFDAHRTGKYDLTAPNFGRSCLPVEQIEGWRQNQHGRWTSNLPRPPRGVDPEAAITPTPATGVQA